MNMAKASNTDLNLALNITRIIDDLEQGYMPNPEDAKDLVHFDIDELDDCQRVIKAILAEAKKGSLLRVTFGMHVLCDPENTLLKPDSDILEPHPLISEMESDLQRETEAARYWNMRYHQMVQKLAQAEQKYIGLAIAYEEVESFFKKEREIDRSEKEYVQQENFKLRQKCQSEHIETNRWKNRAELAEARIESAENYFSDKSADEVIEILSRRPIPAQQSPAVAVPDHWAIKNPGIADQFKNEAIACRLALGFKADADDVAPVDLIEKMESLKIGLDVGDFELFLVEYHSQVWAAASDEDGKTSYDDAGKELAKSFIASIKPSPRTTGPAVTVPEWALSAIKRNLCPADSCDFHGNQDPYLSGGCCKPELQKAISYLESLPLSISPRTPGSAVAVPDCCDNCKRIKYPIATLRYILNLEQDSSKTLSDTVTDIINKYAAYPPIESSDAMVARAAIKKLAELDIAKFNESFIAQSPRITEQHSKGIEYVKSCVLANSASSVREELLVILDEYIKLQQPKEKIAYEICSLWRHSSDKFCIQFGDRSGLYVSEKILLTNDGATAIASAVKFYGLLQDSGKSEPSELVKEASAPYPHPRVSKEDAREIAYNFAVSLDPYRPINASFLANEWANGDGCSETLNKINGEKNLAVAKSDKTSERKFVDLRQIVSDGSEQ